MWMTNAAFLALFCAMAAIFGMAWWTVKKSRPGARIWALVASASNVLTFLPIVYFVPHLVFSAMGVLLGLGVTGLVVFSLPQSAGLPQPAKPRIKPIAGDGTSHLLNRMIRFIGLAGGCGAYFWWLHWTRINEIPTSRGLIFYAWLFAIATLVTTVHEAGHASVGWCLGMKIRSFTAGPFRFQKRGGKWTFQFNLAGLLSAEGATGVVPTTTEENRRRDICMIAAGPLANLFAAIVCLLIVLGTPLDTATETLSEIIGYVALFGASSLIAFATNLIPLKTDTNYSDGAKIYQLITNGPFADLHRVFSAVTSSLVTPLRPRDFDIVSIERATSGVAQGQQLMLLRLFQYQYFLDHGQLEQAGQALSTAESVYDQGDLKIPAGLHTVFVFGYAYIQRDALKSRQWWDRMEAAKPKVFNNDYWMANSALLWSEGRLPEAYQSWEKANALAQQLPSAGAYDFDRHCLALLREALDVSAAAA